MTHWLFVVFAVTAAAAPPGVQGRSAAVLPCDAPAAADQKPAARLLESAACFDDAWHFTSAAEILTRAVKLLQDEAAARPDPPPPAGAVAFAGGDLPLPERRNAPMAQIPGMVLLRGITGVVIVEAVVDREGRVKDTRVVESVPQLDRYAVEIVRQMRYQTTVVKGGPVEIAMFVPIRFGLPSEPTPAERIRLALVYYREGRAGVAAQTALLALHHLNRDVARTGGMKGDKPVPAGAEGTVPEPTRVHFVEPEYPSFVVRARVEGTVLLSAIIDREGRIARVKVVRGVPGLDAPAVDAVLQWRYTPTTFRGEPATVLMSVVVNFRLAR